MSAVADFLRPFKKIPEGYDVIGMELDRLDRDQWKVRLHIQDNREEADLKVYGP